MQLCLSFDASQIVGLVWSSFLSCRSHHISSYCQKTNRSRVIYNMLTVPKLHDSLPPITHQHHATSNMLFRSKSSTRSPTSYNNTTPLQRKLKRPHQDGTKHQNTRLPRLQSVLPKNHYSKQIPTASSSCSPFNTTTSGECMRRPKHSSGLLRKSTPD
jgi:hypothetical protein